MGSTALLKQKAPNIAMRALMVCTDPKYSSRLDAQVEYGLTDNPLPLM